MIEPVQTQESEPRFLASEPVFPITTLRGFQPAPSTTSPVTQSQLEFKYSARTNLCSF